MNKIPQICVFGRKLCFWGTFLGGVILNSNVFVIQSDCINIQKGGANTMQKRNYKGRCEKLSVSKAKDVCHIYNDIQKEYLFKLQDDKNIKEIRCNVFMEGLELGEFTSDFQCITIANDIIIRECVHHNTITKPLTAKRLDASREYWLRHGIEDWGIVTDEEK